MRKVVKKQVLLQGNEACVEGALMAGCRFYAGYPITPATEVMEIMAEKMPETGGVFIQMEDEIASLGAVIGASLAGLKSMTATSGPGFSLMQEHIGFASMAEVPCVIVDVMRAGPSTGLPTQLSQGDVMQARWGTHGDHSIIVLAPSSVYEFFELTVQAFNLSERYRTPVILLVDEVVAHMREGVILPAKNSLEIEERPHPTVPPEWYIPYADPGTGVPPMPAFGDGYRYHVTGLYHDVRGYPTVRTDEVEPLIHRLFTKISKDFDRLQWFDAFETEDARVTVIAYGCVARAAHRAVRQAREKGLKVGLIKLKILWPFMRRTISGILANSQKVLVPELNVGQISREVKRVNESRCEVVTLNKVDGTPIKPAEILQKLGEIYS
ncbi:MAG: 2-oxoacid:acceptor oxidoreductase subunit alpha [Dehalococcoidia bacterium]|nr:MAG: 2-oxoacid:acceptor oxidoreductase subunit alpha [Dehalococcoidia bacterium]